ncbi:MAG: magnesium transporter CorA family protein [Roseiarcus sp.]
MIIVHRQKAPELAHTDGARVPPSAAYSSGPSETIPSDALWIDLFNPTAAEDRRCETHLGIDIPTRSDINYVEPAGSLYAERGARYVSAQFICDLDGSTALGRATFILTAKSIVTVRYEESDAFNLFSRRLSDSDARDIQPETILAGLINTIVDRTAHEIEVTDQRLDAVSASVFGINETTENHDLIFKEVLRALGEQSKRISNIRESLVSLERVLLFLLPDYQASGIPTQLRDDVRATLRDLQSLEEHATFQTQKVQFLLDTTLGLINLEQSHIIKLFSVLAVIFMPPTLIASIYGMNFKNLPELDWTYGYPLAIALMAASSALLYAYFRRKRWL